MSTARLLNVPQRLALTCVLLIVFAALPLHAQFTYQDLFEFDNCFTGLGCEPKGQLTVGSDGNLYGTGFLGGPDDHGAIFMMTPSGAFTNLLSFNGTTGEDPEGGLILASDGNFYGTTSSGGSSGYGTLFRLTPSAVFTVLHQFKNGTDGAVPWAPPTEAKDGNLYGVTVAGTAYRVTLPGGTFKSISTSVPINSQAPLSLASNGDLYGTTFGGEGTYFNGSVFRMSTGGVIKVMYGFSGTDGSNPASPVVQGSDGNLYGTTVFGGANGTGEVFKLTLSGKLTVLHNFSAQNPTDHTNSDGAGPTAGLFPASDGTHLYGTTSVGGANASGTIFEITTGGTFNKFFDFTGNVGPTTGAGAESTLMQHTNGSIYGATEAGGANDAGVFYRLSPANPVQVLEIAGPAWVKPGEPVEILGSDLSEISKLTFGGVKAKFQPGSDTFIIATVPNAAVDGLITATLTTGQQIKTQNAIHILPVITNLDPSSGAVGAQISIVGGGFVGTQKVTFGGGKSAAFKVVSATTIHATVPAGAKTGRITVITANGSAISQAFTVR
jgi:uncharacterized repeat protein (TIGR03803 family)